MTDPQLAVSPYPGPLTLSLACIDPGPNHPTHRRRLRLGTIRDCIGTKERKSGNESNVSASRMTYQISSTQTTALSSSVLEVLRLLHCLLLCFLLVHTCLLPHHESLSSRWREIGAQFVSL